MLSCFTNRLIRSAHYGIPRLPATWAASRALASSRRALAAAAGKTEPERLILGIESSCDDTGVAVVSTSGRVLGESLATQTEIHAAWGGVVPKLAQEAHEAAIDSCVAEALTKAGIKSNDLDAVAVTIGPGLSLCLRVGVLKATEIAATHRLPVIPVHHMEAHALVARLGGAGESSPVQFPFLCVLVSGGHNLLMIVEGVGRYIQLGTTLDDALGEAYDKVARLLGLELKPSGGAALETLALEGDPTVFKFTTPLQKHKTCDFSYAGLKTGVRMRIEEALGGVELPVPSAEEDPVGRKIRADIAASFQAVAVRHLEDRCGRAVQWAAESHPELEHIVVAGGVASNKYLRNRLAAVAEEGELQLICPPPRLCTDNGVMVGWAGVERFKIKLGIEPPPASAVPGEDEWVDLRPRWPLTDRKDERSIEAPRSAKKKNIFESLEALTAGKSP